MYTFSFNFYALFLNKSIKGTILNLRAIINYTILFKIELNQVSDLGIYHRVETEEKCLHGLRLKHMQGERLSLTNNAKLAQSGRHWSRTEEVQCSIPSGGNFLLKLCCSSLRKPLLSTLYNYGNSCRLIGHDATSFRWFAVVDFSTKVNFGRDL